MTDGCKQYERTYVAKLSQTSLLVNGYLRSVLLKYYWSVQVHKRDAAAVVAVRAELIYGRCSCSVDDRKCPAE